MELAKELRRHRDGSIQTSQQYIYAHSALLKLLAIVSDSINWLMVIQIISRRD